MSESALEVLCDYLEDLKLNIQCDEDDSHTAVLFCTICNTSLCRICSDRIHSMKSLWNHGIVRLTLKPEPPIFCHLHPQKPAELVCKDPSCDGINKPMCIMCHQYETHKNHKYTILENEYDRIRTNARDCLEKIEKKREACNLSLNKIDSCISTYSIADPGFMQIERDKIDKFYADARSAALKKLDDFAKSRIEKLDVSKNQYIQEKSELDNMCSMLRNVEEMRKKEVIESGEVVEKMLIEVGKTMDEPKDLVPSSNYSVSYPNTVPMNIMIYESRTGLANVVPRRYEEKTVVICSNIGGWTRCVLGSSFNFETEQRDNGVLYKYNCGVQKSFLELKRQAIDLKRDYARYKYVGVITCFISEEEDQMAEMKQMVSSGWYSNIFVLIDFFNCEHDKEFVERWKEVIKIDKRVKALKYNLCDMSNVLNFLLDC